ncbi:uncharacterized protein BCR38DRAFT_45907 [Pseudomassariella vexata]|uniref:NYN domain-containing protein n=1 Tax=Pseudomassariella vexata TaxID=1141098 RepID=A0A1Y2DNI8_9PEZI|nr:uncharacterized protein BCR38DRAFT_45907 [Pseudomassariella vexata]ORY60739.1 hypothetical protein BCR38DRAFT_45907 [Pseudomassariella vexata]
MPLEASNLLSISRLELQPASYYPTQSTQVGYMLDNMDSMEIRGLAGSRLCQLALPQRPGPNGSRVVRKRPSSPRLGDFTDVKVKLFGYQKTSEKQELSDRSSDTWFPDTTNDSLSISSSPIASLTLSSADSRSTRNLTPESSPPTPCRGPSLGDNLRNIGKALPVYDDVPATTQLAYDEVKSQLISFLGEDHVMTIPTRGKLESKTVPAPDEVQAMTLPAFSKFKSRTVPAHDGVLPVYNKVHSKITPVCEEVEFTNPRSYPEAKVNTVPAYHGAGSRQHEEVAYDLLKQAIQGGLQSATSQFYQNSPYPSPPLKKTSDHPTSTWSNIYQNPLLVEPSSIPLVTPITPPLVLKQQKLCQLNKKLKSLPSTGPKDVHIFVDMSNIFISFQNLAKAKRGMRPSARAPFLPLSFEHLSHILERGRHSVTRKLAGSVKYSWHKSSPPIYIQEAQVLNYDVNLFVRVPQATEASKTKTWKTNVPVAQHHWITTSDDESAESHERDENYRLAEQGVDEHLHFGMTKVVLRNQTPGVIVLATGDARPAEFSEGFAIHALEALQRGWQVELVSWRQSMSAEWKKTPFSDIYAYQFRIIELDPFFDELHADWD